MRSVFVAAHSNELPPCDDAIFPTSVACSSTEAGEPWNSKKRCGSSGKESSEYALHAAIFAVLALSALAGKAHQPVLDDVLAVLGFAYASWYLVLAFRTAYGGSWRRSMGRAAIVGTVYGVALLLATVAVALLAVFL